MEDEEEYEAEDEAVEATDAFSNYKEWAVGNNETKLPALY